MRDTLTIPLSAHVDNEDRDYEVTGRVYEDHEGSVEGYGPIRPCVEVDFIRIRQLGPVAVDVDVEDLPASTVDDMRVALIEASEDLAEVPSV